MVLDIANGRIVVAAYDPGIGELGYSANPTGVSTAVNLFGPVLPIDNISATSDVAVGNQVEARNEGRIAEVQSACARKSGGRKCLAGPRTNISTGSLQARASNTIREFNKTTELDRQDVNSTRRPAKLLMALAG